MASQHQPIVKWHGLKGDIEAVAIAVLRGGRTVPLSQTMFALSTKLTPTKSPQSSGCRLSECYSNVAIGAIPNLNMWP